MKVIHGGSNVIASRGVRSEANFQIQASAQAFRILSSGLYSDKIAAVLREIGCNAADSHVAAGISDRPIEVKLPTNLDSSFYIKDYGTGLTHDEVTGLFTTYFSSNKGESNEMTGAFGLGSKSPFSYTDSFMVTAVKDGLKRFYTAHIGEDGSPVITMLGDGEPADADWPSGMMVSFPVQKADVGEFRIKAKRVFRWFRVKPNLLGAESIKAPVFKVTGSNFWLGATGDEDGGAKVIMGNVAYPLSKERLATNDALVSALIDGGIHVQVGIGDVMPTASREDLEYDPRTRANLEAALIAVAREIGETILKKATRTGITAWERQKKLCAYNAGFPRGLAGFGTRFLQLLDLPKEQVETLAAAFGRDHLQIPTWAGAGYRGNVMSGTQPVGNVLRVHLYRQGEREGTVQRREVVSGRIARGSALDPALVMFKEAVQIVIADAPHASERIKSYVGDQERATAIISVSGVSKDQLQDAQAYAQRLATELGGLPVVSCSSFEVPETVSLKKAKAKGAKVEPKKLHAKETVSYADFTTGQGVSASKLIKMSEVPAAGQFYLIETRRRSPFESHVGGRTQQFDTWGMNRLITAYRSLAKLGVPLTQIDGVVRVTQAKAKALDLKDGGWVNVFSAMLESVKSKEVLGILEEKVSKMPRVDLNRGYYGGGGDALLQLLAREAQKSTALWAVLKPVMEQHPRLLAMIKDLLASSIGKSQRVEARAAVDDLGSAFRPIGEAFEALKLLDASDLGDMLKEQYPLVACVDVNLFVSCAANDAAQAAQYLLAVLDGPREVEKVPAKSRRKSDNVVAFPDAQLPLALAS